MQNVMRRLGMLGVLLGVMLTMLPLTVQASNDKPVDKTCKNLGYDNLGESVGGEWGSIVFDDSEETLGLVVNEGYQVKLCVKAGSANQGLGPEESGPYGEGEYVVGHSSDKELSHFGFKFRTTTSSTSSTTTTVTVPPTTEPPVTVPPVTEPPVTEPPATQPPVTQPPATIPPVLPFTGFDSPAATTGAILLLVAGLAALYAARRRGKDAYDLG